MKMKWLTMISLSVLFCACSKENTPTKAPVAGEKFPVKMSVADFIKKVEQLPAINGRANAAFARDSALATKITDLYYFVTNGYYGDVMLSKHQASTDVDFGSLLDSLPIGNYYLSVMATTKPFRFSGPVDAYIPIHFVDGVKDEMDEAWHDMFYSKRAIAVKGPDSTNNFPISLQRNVAQLEVNIADAPAIADSNIKVHVVGERPQINIKTGESSGQYWLPVTRRSQTLFNDLVLAEYVDINITYPDKQTNAILTKQIKQVRLPRNTKTILTGNLYTPIPTNYSGFSVQVQDVWNPSQIINF